MLVQLYKLHRLFELIRYRIQESWCHRIKIQWGVDGLFSHVDIE